MKRLKVKRGERIKRLNYSKFNSFRLMLSGLLQTKIIKGNYIKFFIERVISYLEILINNHSIKKKFAKFVKLHNNIIIQNKVGKFYANLGDDSLNKYSIYFEYKIQHWFNYDKRKDLFVDIGANRGEYTIQALNVLNYKKAIVFEPLNKNLTIIKKNLELNNLKDKAVIYPYALSNENKKIKIEYDSHNIGIASLEKKSGNVEEEIVCKKLDELVKENSLLKKASFIKIDVEGHEYHVLQGGLNFFKSLNKGTYLMIKIWEDNKYKERTLRFLKQLGFEIIEKKIIITYLRK